jgi:hypothetical protein
MNYLHNSAIDGLQGSDKFFFTFLIGLSKRQLTRDLAKERKTGG